MAISPLNQVAAIYQSFTNSPMPAIITRHLSERSLHAVTVAQLAKLLLDRDTPSCTRDEIWAHVAAAARSTDAPPTVIAVGLALPGLRRCVARVRHVWPHFETDDIESEVLTGFIIALKTIDLDEPHICSRLCQAAFSAGRTWARGHIHAALAVQRMYESRTPPRVYGHPDLVLAQAVRENIISAIDAQLITTTRLDRMTLAKAAADTGISVAELRIQRRKAETALATWITS